MDFRAQRMDFEEADRRHAELARQRAAGELSAEEFEARGRDLMVLDDDGRWWLKDPSSGAWNYHNGTSWLPGTPPNYAAATAAAAPVAQQQPPQYPPVPPDPAPYPTMQDAPVSQAEAPYAPAPQAAPAGRRRGMWRWLLGFVVTVAILAFVGLAAVALLFFLSDPSSQGGQQDPAPQESGASSGEGSPAAAVGFDAAFVHTSTGDNISANSTYLDHPLLNGNPDAVVYVTQNWNPSGSGGTYNDHPVGVWYDGGRDQWAIFNQDRDAMPEDAAFNVAVLSEAPEE